jgi:hypothetical protein
MGALEGNGDRIVGSVVLDENDVRRALELTPRIRAFIILIAAAGTLVSVAMPPHIPVGLVFFALLPLAQNGRKRAASTVLQGLGSRELDVTFEFTPTELNIVRPAGSSRSEWSLYRHFTEVPTAFLIYTNALVFQIVPKRAFAEADIPRLRSLLAARLTPPPRPTGGWKRIVILWLILISLFVAIWQVIGKDAVRPRAPHATERQ